MQNCSLKKWGGGEHELHEPLVDNTHHHFHLPILFRTMLCTQQVMNLLSGRKEEWVGGYWIGSVDGWESLKDSSSTSTTQQRLLVDQLTPKMKSVYHAVLRFYSGLVLPDYSMRDRYIKQSTSVRKAYLA